MKIPGILPVANVAQTRSFAAKVGATIPDWPDGLFDGLDDDPITRDLVAASGVGSLESIEQSKRHRHDKAQLLYSARGVINCEVEDGVWIVPPLIFFGVTLFYVVAVADIGSTMLMKLLIAVLAAYPWSGHQFLDPRTGTTEVRAIMGDADEWCSPMQVQGHLQAIRLAGGRATLRLVGGAHHSFDRGTAIADVANASVSPAPLPPMRRFC